MSPPVIVVCGEGVLVGCTVREYYTPCPVDSTWVVLRALLIRLQAHRPRDRLVIVASLCDAFRVLCVYVCGWSDKDSTVPARCRRGEPEWVCLSAGTSQWT